MAKRNKWPESDLKWLKANYKKFTYKEIATKLGRTELAIRVKVIVCGWANPTPRWRKNEIRKLKELYNKVPIDKVAKELKRTKNSVFCKTRRLKIAKSK